MGFRVQGGPKRPAVGAQVSLSVAGQVRRAPIVTGDSFLAQHTDVVHFGLGAVESLEWVEVRWPDGHTRRTAAPAVGAYHRLNAGP